MAQAPGLSRTTSPGGIRRAPSVRPSPKTDRPTTTTTSGRSRAHASSEARSQSRKEERRGRTRKHETRGLQRRRRASFTNTHCATPHLHGARAIPAIPARALWGPCDLTWTCSALRPHTAAPASRTDRTAARCVVRKPREHAPSPRALNENNPPDHPAPRLHANRPLPRAPSPIAAPIAPKCSRLCVSSTGCALWTRIRLSVSPA